MNKKVIIGISIGLTAVLVTIITYFGISISGRTKEAQAAASEFTSLLQNGELERLSLEYYTFSNEENSVYKDENGVVKGQTLTKQQVAEIYGLNAVMGLYGNEEEDVPAESDITKEQIFKIIMRNTQMVSSVGTIWGEEGKMNLQMMIPDIKGWLQSADDEELRELNAIESNSEFLAELEARMESGEIAKQYVQMSIPMKKQNGKWRFEVTEELEQKFFGGLYNLFDAEDTDADALVGQK